MALNKKSVDDINAKGKRVLVRCDFNVPLKNGEITDDTRIKAALPTIKKLLNDGGKVILCSHLGKVKNGPNEGESLAPVAKRLEELLGQKVNFVSDYNVTGEAATKAVNEMEREKLYYFRIHVSVEQKRQRTAKSSLRNLLILQTSMYVMLLDLLTEHMHLLQVLQSSFLQRVDRTLLVT